MADGLSLHTLILHLETGVVECDCKGFYHIKVGFVEPCCCRCCRYGALLMMLLVLRIWFGLLQGWVSQHLVKESDRLDMSWVFEKCPAVELKL